MIDRPATPAATNPFTGTETATGANDVAAPAAMETPTAPAAPERPPPVDPKYRLNRKKKFRLPYAEQGPLRPG